MKKAISPLIATVLLIGFTVALAAVIMTWGQGFTKKITSETETTTEQALQCTKVNFEISSADCTDNKLTITNNGNTEIKSLKFRIYKTTAVDVEDSSTLIGSFDVESITLTTSLDTTVTKIEAIPTLAGPAGSKDFTCENVIVQYENPCAT